MPLPLLLLDSSLAIEYPVVAHQAIAGQMVMVNGADSWPGGAEFPPVFPSEIASESNPGGGEALPTASTNGWIDKAVPTPPLAQQRRQPTTAEAPPPQTAPQSPQAPRAQGPETLQEPTTPQEPAPPQEPDTIDSTSASALILRADRQTYEPGRQIVTATGDVLVQLGNTQLAADRLWINLNNRLLRAEGNVFFNRNQQVVQGDRATYNLLQGEGQLTHGHGVLQVSTLGDDFSTIFANDVDPDTAPVDYRLRDQGSISQVTSPGGLSLTTIAGQRLFGGEQGNVRRLRFESRQLAFDADGWYGDDVRLTNDPFSPPELEFRGNHIRFTPLNEEEDELCIDSPRVVFDQGLTIPILRSCYTLQRGRLPADAFNPLPTSLGYDGRDRSGLFIERELPVFTSGIWRLSVAPQLYISRWLSDSDLNLFDPANFGFVARLRGAVTPRTSVRGFLSLPGLDLKNFTERVRANFRVQQQLGTHRLNLEYTYRDRLFNGSLGFQDVQTSVGALLESPLMTLGNSQINLSYQVSGQFVTANSDQPDLLEPGETLGLASLFRFQGSVDLSRNFTLWRGQPKPSTPQEGLRYSPRPLIPSLSLIAGLRGVATYYTSNDLQESLEARIALAGQLGHLARDYFDYTQFNIGFSSNLVGGDTSPFLFDRVADQNVLSGGITQQIYGPILVGFQTSFNIDNGREIDTNFLLEYRRRTYGVVIRYSPIQETGFVGFRLSDFNWTGLSEPFDGASTNEDIQIQ